MRFLLTRLYDWAATPAGALVTRKDPLEYLRITYSDPVGESVARRWAEFVHHMDVEAVAA